MNSPIFIAVAFFFLITALALRANPACPERPFPQAHSEQTLFSSLSQEQMNTSVTTYYIYWKEKYLKPSVKVPGDYKIAFTPSGTTVSEAMGYGMLITVLMAGSDPEAQTLFDGLNRFRKRYPSNINPALMCWKVPANEKPVSNDSATDGDLDMALALLMAHRQWGTPNYEKEAKILIQAMASSLVRSDASLRLGDWDTEAHGIILTRPSDFMPTHFRAFQKATGDPIWERVESRCDDILEQLQNHYSPTTGLIPDFSEFKNDAWQPAKPKALEGPYDGDYSYNACRVPWRIGSAAMNLHDSRALRLLDRFMNWASAKVGKPEDFKAGYRLDGRSLKGADFDSACFISPTGVAAMSIGNQAWKEATFSYASGQKEGYYEDSINLLCLITMSGNFWLP